MSNFYDHLDPDIKTILLAQIRNVWTHNSTSLEGNSLTLGETDFILEEGLTIQGKPLKDHNEVYGHAKAIELIYALLNSSPLNITRQDIFSLHETVLTEHIRDVDQPVGNWKSQSNFTTYVGEDNKQAWREYPFPQNIDSLMSQWLANLNVGLSSTYTSQEAASVYADLHLSFVSIHPFFDGNGRMARLLANLPVLKSGFPPIVVPEEDRYQYKLVLSNYQNTIPDLADLSDLKQLPDNGEKHNFVVLCNGYWKETINLLDKANEIQEKRALNAKQN
ncbi:MAG: Fic family protein [Methylobacter sp.]|nr:Fic family protein [Methylobacter sp.]